MEGIRLPRQLEISLLPGLMVLVMPLGETLHETQRRSLMSLMVLSDTQDEWERWQEDAEKGRKSHSWWKTCNILLKIQSKLGNRDPSVVETGLTCTL